MNRALRNGAMALANIGFLTGTLCGPMTVGALAQNSRTRTATFEKGTVIPVVMETQLASNKAQKGDRFTARVKTTEDSYMGLPKDARIEGRVIDVQAKKDKDPGVLGLSFDRIRMPDGRSYPIEGSLIGLDNKSVDKKSDGTLVAKPGKRNDTLKYVGYGAAAGVLVSILGNRGRITIENILLGAAAGFGVDALLKSQQPKEARDVVIKSGTEMGVRLDRATRLSNLSADYDSDEPSDEGRYRVEEGRSDTSDRNIDPRRPEDREEDTPGDIGLLVGDENVRLNSKARPFRSGETWMIPARPTLEAAKARYRYDAGSRMLEVTNAGITYKVGVGSRVAVSQNGDRRRLPATVREVDGTLFVPARFLEIALLKKFTWDRSSNTLVFSSDNEE